MTLWVGLSVTVEHIEWSASAHAGAAVAAIGIGTVQPALEPGVNLVEVRSRDGGTRAQWNSRRAVTAD